MFGILRSGASGQQGDAAEGRGRDPLAKAIILDLLITTAGFLMAVAAVVLTVEGLSLH
jgi:hypothetical protein